MEMDDNKEQKEPMVVRTVNRLLKLMGVRFPKDIPVPKSHERPRVHDFTHLEMRHVTGFDKDFNTQNIDGSAMYDYISRISQSSRSWSKEIRNLKIMAPEINQARDTVVSTILSPTDLQTDKVSIIVKNTGLGDEIEDEIGTMLQEFFNNEYCLSEKMVKWIGDALYETGATSLVVMPEKNLDLLNKAIDVDDYKSGTDPFDRVVKDTKRKGITGSVEGASNIMSSCEAFMTYSSDADIDNFVQDVTDEFVSMTYSEESAPKGTTYDKYTNAAKDIAVKLTEMLNNNKNYVMFANDPSILNATKIKLSNKIDQMAGEISNNFIFGANSPTYIADLGRKHGKEEVPVVMNLPYHAVIPVTVPNAPDAHIGYFVIVNEWGTPLNEDYYDIGSSTGSRKMADAGVQTIMGRPISSALSVLTEVNKFEVASNIFGVMLRHMMDNKLNEFELAGATVQYREAVSATVFRQLINKKKVGVVFVPEPLMTYLCYDYNDDGTGKSCIQDINIIVSLRNILLISGVMAAAENSIDKKKIEVAVDEKNANIEQTLNMVRNAFIEKNMMRFDNNPHTIQRDLVQKSLSIYPKGVRGLQDALNVTIDRASTNAIEPNENLLSKLTDMLIMSLIAPASSMNKTGEEEYSRSVATTNLFFNNKIRSYQSHTTQYINKFIRLYIYYSSLLRDKIREILELAESKMNTKREIEYDYGRSTEAVEDPSMGEGTEPEDAESEGSGDDLFKEDEKDEDEEERKHTVIQPQVKKAFKTNKGDIEENIRKVIQNVTIKLPAPRIVVDKAHFEEIQSYISTLDTILQAVYPDESTMGYEGYDKALTMLRACVKEEMIREYVQTLGFQSNYNMPTLEDIDFSHMEENMLKLINVIKGMGDIKKHIGDRVSPPEESGFGSSGFGGSPYGGSSPYGSEAGGGFGEEGGGEPPGLGDEGPSLDEGPQEPEGGEETTPAEQTEQSPGTGTQSTATT